MVDEETLIRLVHSAKELKILKAITQITKSTDNLDVIISKIIGLILNEIDVKIVFFVVEENGQLVIKNLDENRPLNEDFEQLVLFVAQDTVKYSSPILVKQTRNGTIANRFGIKSFISVPLMLHEGPIGSIVLMAQYRSFTQATVKLLSTIANQTASAVEHLWLKKAMEEKEKKITKLYTKLYTKETRRAITDALTGLFNKRYFVELISSKVKSGKAINLIMVDLDFFKHYNDTFGHVEGDVLLKNLGKLVQKLKDVKACRYGGEEFAIIVESDVNDAIAIAEELRQEVEKLHPKKAKRPVTASLGVGQRKRGENVDEFIKRVDAALYKAKESGRNQVQIAN